MFNWKFSLVVLFLPLVIADFGISKKEFIICDNNWMITNMTYTSSNNTVKILFFIIEYEEKDNMIHNFIITCECTNNTNCLKQPKEYVTSFSCNDSNELEGSEKDICEVARKIKLIKSKQDQWLDSRYGPLLKETMNKLICFFINMVDFNTSDSNSSNSNSNE